MVFGIVDLCKIFVCFVMVFFDVYYDIVCSWVGCMYVVGDGVI